MGVSDKIEAFINELMKDETDYAEFGRNELADLFGCVPSQINYVISTRFSPEKGYCVESRRGGGGYIKIRKIRLGGASDVIAGIKESCTAKEARTVIENLYRTGSIDVKEAHILMTVCGDKALAECKNKDKVRSDILKNVISEL